MTIGISMFSGGVGSWLASKRYTQQNGIVLLFADTLIEDADLYRFLIQGACNIFGFPESRIAHLKPLWESIPPLSRDMQSRKIHLWRLATEAHKAMERLVWLRDGRTPWEVFRDVRWLGNTRAAPCSHKLKQDVCRQWVEDRTDPSDTEIVLGIDWQEQHRLDGANGRPGARAKWLPWRVAAPLCEPPHLSKYEMLQELEREGIDPPRLYDLGFSHNNCGGFCVKAGHQQFKLLLETLPEVYSHHAQQEERLRLFLQKDVAILRDRRGGKLKPLPMVDFRNNLKEVCDPRDSGGCGCFVDEEE